MNKEQKQVTAEDVLIEFDSESINYSDTVFAWSTCIAAMEQYAAPLQARIAELEKQNAVYREALENIASATDGNNPGHAVFYFTAKQALNQKEGK